MGIEKISPKKLKPAPYNPRNMKSSELEKLKKSIKTYSCYEPLIVNSQTWHVVGGNQRLRALIELGYKEVDVVVVDLSLEQEKALNIALNKISGEWDEDMLAVLLEELQKIPDFDTGLTGFDFSEISQIFDRFYESKNPDDFDLEAEVESIKESITKRGDVIQLGRHFLMCGDSSNSEDLKYLMGDDRANLLNTDFPYNVNYMGGDRPDSDTRPKKSRKWNQIYSDNMPQKEYENWMEKVLENTKRFLFPGAAIYIWQGHRQIPPIYQILLGLDFHVSCIINWIKPSAAISYADYPFRSEHALYGFLKGAAHYWAGPKNENDVWEIGRDPTANYQHPTQKPIELASRAIRNSSKRGDSILDIFGGAGFSLLAAENLQRRCFCMEIDPIYCDVIVKRYIAYVGQDKVSPELIQKYLKEVPNAK